MIKTQVIAVAGFEPAKRKDGSVVSGKNNKGGSWTMYKLKDDKGLTYTTFDARYEQALGKTIEIIFEEEQDGKFVNRSIISKEVAKKKVKEVKIEELEKRVTALEELIKNPGPEIGGHVEDIDDCIDDRGLPF